VLYLPQQFGCPHFFQSLEVDGCRDVLRFFPCLPDRFSVFTHTFSLFFFFFVTEAIHIPQLANSTSAFFVHSTGVVLVHLALRDLFWSALIAGEKGSVLDLVLALIMPHCKASRQPTSTASISHPFSS